MKMKKMAMALVLGSMLGSASVYAIGLGTIEGAVKDTAKVAKTMSISDDEEVAIGTQAHPSILAQFGGAVNDAKLQKYIDTVGQKLVKVSDRKDIPYHFTVVNASDFNAFAVPGGYVYVTRGLLSAMKDESELAAVLGHELTHVTHRHGVKQMQQAALAGTGAKYATKAASGAVGGAAGGAAGALSGEALKKVTTLFANFAVQGYGRAHELDSDKTGIRFANSAGYDPEGAVRMFEYLLSLESGEKPSGMNALLASHPNTDKRLVLAKEEVAKISNPGKTTNAKGYLAAVKNLKK